MNTRTARPSERFTTHLEELKAALAEQGLTSGLPGDLVRVAQAVSTEGAVCEAMTGVLRDLLARSGGTLTRAELASTLVVAAGGTDRYQTALEVDAVGQLDSFVDVVMGAWERREVHASPLADASLQPDDAAEMDAVPQVDPASNRGPAETGVLPRISVALESAGGDDKVAKAIEPFWGVVDGSGTAPRAVSETLKEAAASFVAEAYPARRGRMGWVAGACAAALVVVAGALVWAHRRGSEAEPAQAVARASSAQGEPSNLPVTAAGLPTEQNLGNPGQTAAVGIVSGPYAPNRAAGMTTAAAGQPTVLDAASSHPASTVGSASPASAVPGVANHTQPPGAGLGEKPGHVPSRASGAAGGPAANGSVGPTGKFLVSSGVMGNNLIAATAPTYPKMAKMWGVQGEVILQAVVSRKGQVVSARVLDGHRMLRGAATNAVRKWRYRPYLVNGKPMDVDTVVIVNFKLPS